MKRFFILVILLLNTITIAYANDRGIFWKLKAPNGLTHYLFGTMHTDENRIITFLPIVKQALDASDLLVVEIASDDHAKNLFMSNHSLTSDLNEAYKQGIFPWFNQNEPVLWWSPNPRLVLFPDKLRIASSLSKKIKKIIMNFQ